MMQLLSPTQAIGLLGWSYQPLCRKIRHLLAEGYTNKEIIEILQIEERTFYRYMARIYRQDKAYFEKQDNKSIATEIRLAKERMLKSLRRFDAMAPDETLSALQKEWRQSDIEQMLCLFWPR